LESQKRIDAKPEEIRCPRCHRRDIVPSLPRGIKDMFMEGLGKVPRHCRFCEKRFYVSAARVGVELSAAGENPDDQQKKAGA